MLRFRFILVDIRSHVIDIRSTFDLALFHGMLIWEESLMARFFKDGATIACKREGPLAAHIEPFANSLSKQGYTMASIRRQVRLAAGFSRWLQQQRVSLRSITSDHPRLYLRYRARRLRPCLGDAAGLRHLLEFLRHQ